MNRREFIAAASAGAISPLPATHNDDEQAGHVDGVGVLRYPESNPACFQRALELARGVRKGTIIALPNTTDSWGNFVWDFRIEGGDPGQVQVVRHEQPDPEAVARKTEKIIRQIKGS